MRSDIDIANEFVPINILYNVMFPKTVIYPKGKRSNHKIKFTKTSKHTAPRLYPAIFPHSASKVFEASVPTILLETAFPFKNTIGQKIITQKSYQGE